MKQLYALIIILCTLSIQANAQMGWGKYTDIAALKKRKMVVLLSPEAKENPKVIAKLKKKGKSVDEYRQSIVQKNKDIEISNKKLKELFKEYWTLNSDYEFAIAGTKSAEFIFDCSKYTVRHAVVRSNFSALIIKRAGRSMAEVLIPNSPSPTDFIYGIRLIQEYLEFRFKHGKLKLKIMPLPYTQFADMNQEKLKDKILLIDKDILYKKLDERDVKKLYPFPFEIVSRDKIEEAVLSKDKRYAYIQHVPYLNNGATAGLFLLPGTHIVNTENGRLLGYSIHKGLQAYKMNDLDNGMIPLVIRKSNLSQYAKQAKSKNDK